MNKFSLSQARILSSTDLPGTGVVQFSNCPACPGSPMTLTEHVTMPATSARLYSTAAISVPVNNDHLALLSAYQATGVVVLNRAARQMWESFSSPCSIEQVVRQLRGVLSEFEIRKAIRRLVEGGVLSPTPDPAPVLARDNTLVTWLHISNACNLGCRYCYVEKSSEKMSASCQTAAIDAVFRSAQAHGFSEIMLKFAGGEPFLNFPAVIGMYDHALMLSRETGIRITAMVLSNGTLIRKPQLAALQTRGISLMISLDGLGQAHDANRPFLSGRGSFEQVVFGIEQAAESGIAPHICLTVTEHNAADAATTVEWLLKHKLPFVLNFYRPTSLAYDLQALHKSESHIIEAMQQVYRVIEQDIPEYSLISSIADRANFAGLHDHACPAGRNYMVIDHRGQVSACHMEMDQPVTSIEASDPLRSLRHHPMGSLSVMDRADCRACPWKYWCAGGCPIEVYHLTGRWDRRSPNCEIYRALFPGVVRLEALRLLRYSTPPAIS